MKQYPSLRVIFIGCPYQNDSIVKIKPNTVYYEPIATTLERVFSIMFPYRVVLRINKRSPQDQHKLEVIFHMLFIDKISPKAVTEFIVAQGWIGGVLKNNKDILENGIAMHISYFNRIAIRLNTLVHCDMFDQPYKMELSDGTLFFRNDTVGVSGRMYRRGVRCMMRCVAPEVEDDRIHITIMNTETGLALCDDIVPKDTQLQPIGEYVMRSFNIGLTRNTSLRLTELPTEQNKSVFKFRQSDAAKIADITVKEDRVSFDTFRLPYSITGHSSQGDTIYEKYAIHDIGAFCMSAKWFWTSITRSINLSNIYVVLSADNDARIEKACLAVARTKLKSYIETDKATNRLEDKDRYDEKGMAELAKNAHGRRCHSLCGETCESVMDIFGEGSEAISFDRMNNNLGHRLDNLRCVCVGCNRRGQDRDTC